MSKLVSSLVALAVLGSAAAAQTADPDARAPRRRLVTRARLIRFRAAAGNSARVPLRQLIDQQPGLEGEDDQERVLLTEVDRFRARKLGKMLELGILSPG